MGVATAMMIDNKSIQQWLKTKNFYQGPIDGQLGPLTHDAFRAALGTIPGVAKWPYNRRRIAIEQLMMENVGYSGPIDGINGPLTQHALELWQNHLRKVEGPLSSVNASYRWPTQARVPEFYGSRGIHQVRYIPPYQFYLYDSKVKVDHISVHAKVEQSLDKVLRSVYEFYGPDAINELHLNRFFGSMNVRKMRGSDAWSMHSWGIALDFDANRNALRMTSKEAAFAKPAYNQWWKLWEEEGWVSLGRERNYDWMHVQAARL
jgi:peptidoglycan hydrolase-like protein with peptidoglycan-binding domain